MAEQWVEHWVADVTTTDTWAQVVARAWADGAFQARLVADPSVVLREAGLEVPPGMEVLVQEAPEMGEPHGACLVLPPKPAAGELHLEPLARGSGAEEGRLSVNQCKGGLSAI